MARRRIAALLAGASLSLAAGAALAGSAERRPDTPLAGAYQAVPPSANAAAPALDSWWLGFDDPVLVEVVEGAQAGNLDLAQARARVARSRALARQAGANLLPSGGLQGQAQSVRQSLESPFGAIGRHLPGFERTIALYDLSAAADWDLDLAGGLRRGRDAARADSRAQVAQAAAVRLTVIAEAADAYLQVRAYQARLRVAHDQETVEADLAALLRRQVDQGVAPDRDLRQTLAALEAVRATIPPLQTGLTVQLDRLDILMGAQPGAWRDRLAKVAPIPPPPTLRLGDGPADLLRRRPDILAAEQGVLAARARTGQALAEYYPKVSLSGLLGVESLDAARMFTPAATQAVSDGALRWRLFDFPRIDAEVASARASDAEALAAWRATALRACGEVEDAVTALAQDDAQATILDRRIADLTIARRQAEQAYEGGVASLLEVRDIDRELLVAADQAAQARAAAARAAVAAFHALGGGWTPSAPL